MNRLVVVEAGSDGPTAFRLETGIVVVVTRDNVILYNASSKI